MKNACRDVSTDVLRICFYKAADAYGCFSNFSAHPITIDNILWPTSEHYYQAHKFKDTRLIERIRALASPEEAAKYGRSMPESLRPDWERVKIDVMRRAVTEKFTQHLSIRKILLDTGDAELIEHTENDRFWGDGGDGSGLNMLGKLLMEVRASLHSS